MRTNSRLRLTRHFSVFFAGIVLLWLCNCACPILAQDLNWLPTSGVSDPTNWFEPENWEIFTSTPPPTRPPTSTESASVNTTTVEGAPAGTSGIATIGPHVPAAMANELLIGGTIPK